MLEVKSLSYGIMGKQPVVENLSFTLNRGEILQVKGPNGSGKSLLAKAILKRAHVFSGEINNSFTKTRYLSQMQNKSAHLPYSLADVAFDREKKDFSSKLAEVGLLEERHLSLAWNQASGGERQRALLTKFFSDSGELFILDEPMNHLDQRSRNIVREHIKKLLGIKPEIAFLLITHELDDLIETKKMKTIFLSEKERL